MKSNIFDVIVVSKFQISAPHLGVSKAYSQLIESLTKLNLRVCIITEGKFFSVIELNPHLSIKVIPPSKRRIASMINLRLPHPGAAWLSEAKKHLGSGSFVVAPIVGMQTVIFKGEKRNFQRYFATLHTPYSMRSPLGILFFYIQKRSLKFADLVVANSQTILKKLKLDESQAVVIPHPYISEVLPFKKDLNTLSTPIWIGSLTYRKGVDRLTLLMLLTRGRAKIRVVWSKSRFDFLWIPALKFFEYLGWCQLEHELSEIELRKRISEAYCLVSTSRFESFGLTLIEAARENTGVIGVSAPGIVETLPENSGGALYFSNILKLASILKVTLNLEKYNLLGVNASKYVEEKYSPLRIMEIWKEIIEFRKSEKKSGLGRDQTGA